MFRKILKINVLVVVLAFAAAQFIRPNFTNPPVVESETLAAHAQVPADVDAILKRSCNDCHSNETVYPWYSKVTPFNWFLATHIDDGRRELNFSKWGTYTDDQKVHKLDELCEVVEGGAMPLPSYLWIHRDAALAKPQAELLCGWAREETARIEQ